MTSTTSVDLAALTDDELFDHAAAVIAVPRAAAPDSFVLHAPLELLARRGLLARVRPDQHDAARRRIAWVAEKYAGYEPLPERVPEAFASVDAASTRLGAALAVGHMVGVDDAARWLGTHATTEELVALGPDIVDSLAAAGHAPIFTHLLPRVAHDRMAARMLVRPLLRELARYPDWRIEWIANAEAGSRNLIDAVLSTPLLGKPGSDFIFPLMHQVDSRGTARTVLDGVDYSDASRELCRVAAWSMLQDDPANAPYGWTHCLTMTQAAAPISAPVAATFVVGFRAALSSGPIAAGYAPTIGTVCWRDSLDLAPTEAARAAFHTPDADLAELESELATYAAVHEDAHLVKYTLACFDAAEADPEARRLFLAAVAYLGAWWRQKDVG
jgi:hypothetical protein